MSRSAAPPSVWGRGWRGQRPVRCLRHSAGGMWKAREKARVKAAKMGPALIADFIGRGVMIKRAGAMHAEIRAEAAVVSF